MPDTIFNRKGYAYFQGQPNDQPRKTVVVTFITDTIPGAYDKAEDIMRWIATNPYVDSVTLVEENKP